MVKATSTKALRDTFVTLCAERDDQGLGLTLQDVCDRAGVSRATAYRGRPNFKTEFDQTLSALRGDTFDAETDSAVSDTRAGYRKIIAKLANQLQAVVLQLEAERRGRNHQIEGADGSVVPFPGKVQRR